MMFNAITQHRNEGKEIHAIVLDASPIMHMDITSIRGLIRMRT